MGVFNRINRRESDIRLGHLENALDKMGADTHKILEAVKESNQDILKRISDKYATQLEVEREKTKLTDRMDSKLQNMKVEIYKQLARYGSIALAVFGVLGWVIKTVVFK
jgi:hypothetical protein